MCFNHFQHKLIETHYALTTSGVQVGVFALDHEDVDTLVPAEFIYRGSSRFRRQLAIVSFSKPQNEILV